MLISKHLTETKAFSAEIEALRADAERYRWLRRGSNWPAAFLYYDAPEPITGPELDAAIDAAMKAGKAVTP